MTSAPQQVLGKLRSEGYVPGIRDEHPLNRVQSEQGIPEMAFQNGLLWSSEEAKSKPHWTAQQVHEEGINAKL